MTSIDRIHDSRDIIPKARSSIHKTILSWFSVQKRGTVFDAPAGYGHLAMHLRDMGYDVTCGEVDTDIFKVKDLSCIYIDLNERINSSDDAFDYTCCVDGLEHMTNPYKAVQEFARVLKPGGYGVFSIPNYSNIESRSKFFLNGYLTLPNSFDQYRETGCNLYNFHNSPLTITLLDLMFKINGLQVKGILRDNVKWKQYFWFPFILMLKLHAHLRSDRIKKKHRYDLTLRNEVILGSSTLIFITQKASSQCNGLEPV